MSIFEVAMQTVWRDEGEFIDDPRDAGGATKYGISLRWLKSLEPLPEALDLPQAITRQTIAELTREQALALYRQYFWDPHRYERIVDQRIASKAFDFHVNAGAHAAHVALQWALRASGDDRIVIDGVLGDQTIKAVNAADGAVLLAAYRSEMAGYYRRLNQPHFEAGWLKRAYL